MLSGIKWPGQDEDESFSRVSMAVRVALNSHSLIYAFSHFCIYMLVYYYILFIYLTYFYKEKIPFKYIFL